ncbi:hypothetical protein FRB93_002429, partial [Tulasnella sp. JGI-2019a]
MRKEVMGWMEDAGRMVVVKLPLPPSPIYIGPASNSNVHRRVEQEFLNKYRAHPSDFISLRDRDSYTSSRDSRSVYSRYLAWNLPHCLRIESLTFGGSPIEDMTAL